MSIKSYPGGKNRGEYSDFRRSKNPKKETNLEAIERIKREISETKKWQRRKRRREKRVNLDQD